MKRTTFFVATLMAGQAFAHSDGKQHYPYVCCHEMDCAPVTKVEVVPTQKFAAAGLGYAPNLKLPTQTVITTIHGTVVVPENFDQKAIYQSEDGRMHACVRAGKLVCWFIPPGN